MPKADGGKSDLFAIYYVAMYNLHKYSSIRGTLQNVQALTPVIIEGTTYSAVTDGGGAFTIEKIPSGMYALFTQCESGYSAVSSVKLQPDSLVSVALESKSAETFLVTDFECGYKSPVSQAWGIELFWYLFSDSADKEYDYDLSQWVNSTSSENGFRDTGYDAGTLGTGIQESPDN